MSETYHFYITPEQYEIALRNGISNARLYQRLKVQRWTIERAISEPPQSQRKGLWKKWGHLATYNGISKRQFLDRVSSKKTKMSCYEAATRPIRKWKVN